MGQIFSDDAGKKCDKCIQMHYIGKSYVTTVYKCDDEKKSDHSEKQVAQRAMIAHPSPMCQGQISFQKI